MHSRQSGAGTFSLPLLIAVVATVLIVLAEIVFIGGHWREIWSMPPNAWGDFVSGFASPLAFVWLVAGYFMQASELRYQIAEMHQQMQATTQLVEASHEEARRIQAQAQPRFAAGCGTSTGSWLLKIRNTGAKVFEVEINVSLSRPPDLTGRQVRVPGPQAEWPSNPISVTVPENSEGWITITYVDQHDDPGIVHGYLKDKQLRFLPIGKPQLSDRYEREAWWKRVASN